MMGKLSLQPRCSSRPTSQGLKSPHKWQHTLASMAQGLSMNL